MSSSQPMRKWYPRALRWWNLSLAILLCWTFIAVLQYLLMRSQRDNGIIFASNINDLPLRRSFAYLYLPTVIAVLFSVFIVWIDNDAKRFEPYYQMAKKGGARAEDSVLLHYPYDFMPFVPFVSLGRRHWIVFWASTATLLFSFGVVPLQAGIFTTAKVARDGAQVFSVSQQFKPAAMQGAAAVIKYAQSGYGILNLNESMPEFMTKDYTLKPFSPVDSAPGEGDAVWTANTTLYSMDTKCWSPEPNVTVEEMGSGSAIMAVTWYRVKDDCRLSFTNHNNDTIGDRIVFSDPKTSPNVRFKTYSSFFTAYYSTTRTDTLGWSWPCFSSLNGTFMSMFVRNRKRPEDPPNNVTTLACDMDFYQQEVEATVDARTKRPLRVVPLAPRQPLPPTLFNTTTFQETIATGVGDVRDRDERLPGTDMPRYLEDLQNLELTPVETWALDHDLHPMTAMAVTSSNRSLEDFLDPKVLGDAYQASYRLLFVRAMTDILQPNFSAETTNTTGRRLEHLEAVRLEPIFTYIVGALLGLVSLAMGVLMYFAATRSSTRKLADDPASIATVMSMTADSAPLLARFAMLDRCGKVEFARGLRNRRFALGEGEEQYRMLEVEATESQAQPLHKAGPVDEIERDDSKSLKPVRPLEFRLYTAIPFTGLFVALVVVLTIFYQRSRESGLPLPSESRITQILVTQYLPTAVATLIEPMWILINRLLCILQPIEELRTSRARASKSLTLNYTSLPPQLSLFKAIRAGHLMLAAVCAMALLSNLLATTFAGLFFQDTIAIAHPTFFTPPFDARFVNINGTSGPPNTGRPIDSNAEYSGAYQGGAGDEQFLVSESNYTRNTTLPTWVDSDAMYMPFMKAQTQDRGFYQAQTRYFSATPNCKPLTFGTDYNITLWNYDKVRSSDPGYKQDRGIPDSIFEVRVTSADGSSTRCYAPKVNYVAFGDRLGRKGRMDNDCASGKTAAELLTTLSPRVNATQEERELCRGAIAMGWMRTTEPACDFSHRNYNKTANGYEDANKDNTFLITCQPQLQTGTARITVDAQGTLSGKPTDVTPDPDQTPNTLNTYTSNGVSNLIAQSNLFLFRTQHSTWHNDTFASEYMHYFTNRAAGTLALTSPSSPLPDFPSIAPPLAKAYARLFAIWLSINRELLFVPASPTAAAVSGTTLTREERLFFTFPLFVISQVILVAYILVALLVYVRRPGRYLPRLPTNIAAVISLFAASAAVREMGGTAQLTNKEREEGFDKSNARFGYGSFVGTDGGVHVGIERVPFVGKVEGAQEKKGVIVGVREYTPVESEDGEVGRGRG